MNTNILMVINLLGLFCAVFGGIFLAVRFINVMQGNKISNTNYFMLPVLILLIGIIMFTLTIWLFKYN